MKLRRLLPLHHRAGVESVVLVLCRPLAALPQWEECHRWVAGCPAHHRWVAGCPALRQVERHHKNSRHITSGMFWKEFSAATDRKRQIRLVDLSFFSSIYCYVYQVCFIDDSLTGRLFFYLVLIERTDLCTICPMKTSIVHCGRDEYALTWNE